MTQHAGFWNSAKGIRLRGAIYVLLSVVTLIALINTGWAQLGPLGFALTATALCAARLLNRPWLLARRAEPGGPMALSREVAGQVALALALFWIGYGLSYLTQYSPDFGTGRLAAVILIAGVLRRRICPRASPPLAQNRQPAPCDLAPVLAALPPQTASRHQLRLALAGIDLAPDRLALQLIDRAAMTKEPRDGLAMVLALCEPEQARACMGHGDLTQAFDILSENADVEALLTFAIRCAALIESFPSLAADLPRPETLRQSALRQTGPVAAALKALADRIEHHRNQIFSA